VQRRLTATIVSVVVGAILLCGLVTFVLAARAARSRTRGQLVTQATDVAAAIKSEIDQGRPAANILRIIRTPFRDENDVVLIVGPNGRLIDIAQPGKVAGLPSGLRAADLHPDRLLAGQVVSGTMGSTVFAAAPYQSRLTVARTATVTQVVVLTRKPASGLRDAAPWFLLSSVLVLAVAAVIGDRLGRRISGPLRAAESVTRQIAAGDLSAHIPRLAHAYPELDSLTQSVNTMTESLARSRGLERQFLMSVSHDLRTPLTSIRGFAEAISDGAAPDNIRAAGVIASEARRLERLVGDLLDLAKLDARRFSLDLRRIDVAEVVGETVEGFRPAADELGLDLLAEPGPALAATGDPDRLAQVVANLVENALKYATGRVRVAAAPADGHVLIWVDDDGPGIAAADLPRVFDPLFMSSRYPARQVGSGLGLAIVAELVAAMGATVRAESPTTSAGGTRVTVALRSWMEIDTATD